LDSSISEEILRRAYLLSELAYEGKAVLAIAIRAECQTQAHCGVIIMMRRLPLKAAIS